MPSRRTAIFLLIGFILYLLANQTQVGWIYVIAGGIIGLLIVTFLYQRQRLAAVSVTRSFQANPTSSGRSPNENNDFSNDHPLDPPNGESLDLTLPTDHEDDLIAVTLQFKNSSIRPAFLISGQEDCPFAPTAGQSQPFFIPSLFKHQPVSLQYQTWCDRRGLFTFSPLPLQSRGLFGFFKSRRTLACPGDILIYPQYYPLKRLDILEKRQVGQRETAKVGSGSQVIGTREYRPGDSLRQVHWRSTARRGAVVVKEFADEDQLSLTVVLDLYQADEPVILSKFTPFESAIRLAASFGYYATKKHLPFYLIGAGHKGRAPRMALGWSALLTYLAKIKNEGQTPLARLLETVPASPFLIILVSQPTLEIAATLAKISAKHGQTVAIFITADGTLSDHLQPNPGPRLTSRIVAATQWQEGLKSL